MVTADIRAIDPADAGRILSRSIIIVGNLLSLVPLLLGLVGLGLLAYGCYLLFEMDGQLIPEMTNDLAVAASCVFLGLAIAAGSLYWCARNTVSLANAVVERRAWRLISERPDSWVNLAEAETLFVEVVPRRNWKRLMLETATDIGFLTVDELRRQVLFEGDRERLRIPKAAIVDCVVDWTFIGGQGGIKYYFTVLLVQTKNGLREYPFAYRGDMGQLGSAVRLQRATDLRERILSL